LANEIPNSSTTAETPKRLQQPAQRLANRVGSNHLTISHGWFGTRRRTSSPARSNQHSHRILSDSLLSRQTPPKPCGPDPVVGNANSEELCSRQSPPGTKAPNNDWQITDANYQTTKLSKISAPAARVARQPKDAELTAVARSILRATVTNSGEAGRYGRRLSPSTGLHQNFEESFSSPFRRGLPRSPPRFSRGGSGKIQGFDRASTATGEVSSKTFRVAFGWVVRDLLSPSRSLKTLSATTAAWSSPSLFPSLPKWR